MKSDLAVTAWWQMPALCLGKVMHARHRPVENRFQYSIFTLYIPLSRLADVRATGFGVNRPGLMSFWERDHGARDGSPLLPWIRRILQQADLAQVADGEVVLQTLPRLFGYVFNPVSFWYCLDRAGALRAVLAEVNSTFGERHSYLLAHADGRPMIAEDCLVSQKCLHVSPFFAVEGEYRFTFRPNVAANHLAVAIDYWVAGERCLSTRLGGRLQTFSTRSVWAAWGRCPLLTFGVMAKIHWQAVRLLWRRVPFFGAKSPVTAWK